MKRTEWRVLVTGIKFLAIICAAVVVLLRLAYRGVIMDDTRYARHYSEHAFRSIRMGMTKSQVTALLGRPLMVETGPPASEEVWYYSLHGTFGWRQRIVYFGRHRVIETRDTWNEAEDP